MQLSTGHHLTYCTNIHPAESWPDTFKAIKTHVPVIKDTVSPGSPFGIGLRLSNRAANQLQNRSYIDEFVEWLKHHHCYVFTMNGFPYGEFHRQRVKDLVHQPDWSTKERLNYTLTLIDILAQLPSDTRTKGISTSPLSYKPWMINNLDDKQVVFEKSTDHLLQAALHMHHLFEQTGQIIHLDIEPEPDGLIENTDEVISYFSNYLVPRGSDFLQKKAGVSAGEAEKIIKRHLQICYDVCHFAIEYESPRQSFKRLEEEGINIGKIQLSAALKAQFTGKAKLNRRIEEQFSRLNEPTYLHQVISRNDAGKLQRYADLPEALDAFDLEESGEWRTHFHVPLFVKQYRDLQSTQKDIEETLDLLIQDGADITEHLEIETYTWEVLPKRLQADLDDSIVREIRWVLKAI